MSNLVYIAASIDGFIARENGDIDWLMEVPDLGGMDYGYQEFMSRIDGIIMGRKTFEKVSGFPEWPYHKKVFIITHTLKKIPREFENKVELVQGKLSELQALLKQRGFQNLYIDGGMTIQTFLEEDLIDEMIITRIPVILGKGISLFSKMDHELKWLHVETQSYPNGLVQSRYIRLR